MNVGNGHDPFENGFDPELQKVLRETFAHALSDLTPEITDGNRAAVEAAVSDALIALAKVGQRNPEQLRHYGVYKGRQLLP